MTGRKIKIQNTSLGYNQRVTFTWDISKVPHVIEISDTAIFKMNNEQGPTIEHMKVCPVLCGSLGGRGVWGRIATCIRMAESLHSSPESVTMLLTSISQYKIKSLKKCKKNHVGKHCI